MEKLLAPPDADLRDLAPRLRLMAGMAAAVDEKGYFATTIADIVRHARVSKRTFYEHFADKEECFLACYSLGGDVALDAIAQAATDLDAPWRQRVRAATHAYLATLQAQPVLTRTLLLEVHAAGPRALAMRRVLLQRFAQLLRDTVDEGRRCHPELRALSPAMSTALVGGINELVLQTVEEGRAGRLTELEDTIADLVLAVLTG